MQFDAPTWTGGREPVRVGCTPVTATAFPVGETTVSCTAIDADTVQASCEFTIRVRVSQVLSRTKFLAFGDSITAGVVRLAPLMWLERPDAYPGKLEQILRTRYPALDIFVLNEGFSGEEARDGVKQVAVHCRLGPGQARRP